MTKKVSCWIHSFLGLIHQFYERDITTISLYQKPVNELHDWIENHPQVIHYPNVSDSLFFKINDNLVKKQKHILQISVWELQNDMILPIYQMYVLGARNFYGKVCIEDTSIVV